ncbi:MAG: hypothetical protein LBD29_02785 [Treponema sp.]|jgi:hypothetical protein|nr:hypothetical protein [Treponema sp.]
MNKRRFSSFKITRIVGAAAVIAFLGGCNGLTPEDSSDSSGNGAGGLGNVVISLSGSSLNPAESGSRALTDVGLDAPKNYVTYYEAYFATSTGNIIASASSNVGEDRIVLSVAPNSTSNYYQVLVLAGTHANQNPQTGEKVLLGSGYKKEVIIVANQRNEIKVTMYPIQVQLEVTGVSSTFEGNGSNTSTSIINMEKINGLDYVRFAKQSSKVTESGDNPWNNGTIGLDLEVKLALKKLDPLLLAKNNGVPGAVSTTIFYEPDVKVYPLSYRKFAMEPITFIPLPAWPLVNAGSYGGIDNTTLTLDTSGIEFIFKKAAFTGVAPSPIINLPNYDAAGKFSFNYKYKPFGKDGYGYWNIRNRILYTPDGYFGGGVAFLFGNATLTNGEVEVIPDWP